MKSAISLLPAEWSREKRSAVSIAISVAGLFAFLWLMAIPMSWLPEPIGSNAEQFAEGAKTTVMLTVVSGIIGIALGVLAALGKLSRFLPLRLLADFYIWVIRGTPLLVQLFLVYYGLSQFAFIRESSLWPILREPYWCAIITMTLHTAAYIAEILRGAIAAVPVGEIEAARALGMSRALTMRRIVLPIAVRLGLPAYGNEVILMLKGSALASTITLLELTGMARTIIARTYMPVEIFLATGAFYLLISFFLVQAFRLAERALGGHLRASA